MSEQNNRDQDRNGAPRRDAQGRPATNDRNAPKRWEDRKPAGPRSGSSERKPFSRDSRPARDGERKPFSRDDRPARDGERKQFGKRKPFNRDGERKPFSRDDRPARDGERRSYGERGASSERKPFSRDSRPARDGERKQFGERKPFNRDGERKPFSRDDRPARDGERKPFSRDSRPARDGEPKQFGERKPFSRDSRPPRDGERKPFSRDDRPSRDGERRSYGERGASSERKPFSRDSRPPRDGDRKQFNERKPFSRDDRPQREARPPRGDRPATGSDRPSFRRDDAPSAPRPRNAKDLRSANRPDRERSPEIDEDVTGQELDKVTRAQLRNLEEVNGEWVSKHLVMAGRLIDDEPELAFQHALAASRRGGRMAVVREAVGLTAYAAEHFGEALREFRTYRRISGSNAYLPMMADCERGLGHPERALDLVRSEDAKDLDTAGQVDLAIVASGARMDMGQFDAAVTALEIPQLDRNRAFSYSPRLFRAYADALEVAGRNEEAEKWRKLALRADSALGMGDFAEPEIFDLAPEEERRERRSESREDRTGAYFAPEEGTAKDNSGVDADSDALPSDEQEAQLTESADVHDDDDDVEVTVTDLSFSDDDDETPREDADETERQHSDD